MSRSKMFAGLLVAAAAAGCGDDSAAKPRSQPLDGGPTSGSATGSVVGTTGTGTGTSSGGSVHDGGAPSKDASVPGQDASVPSKDAGVVRDAALFHGDGSLQVTPPQVVSACTGDGGLAPVGTWEQITPSGLDLTSGNGVTSVVADPVNSGTVYTGTDKQGIYRSTDCGAHWTFASTGSGKDTWSTGIAWFLAIDPITPNILYGASLYGTDPSLLKSTDNGQNWTSIWNTALGGTYGMQWMSIDPADHLHMVASIHQNCTSPNTPVCLAESHDGGSTWSLVNGPPSLANWEEAAAAYVFNETTFLYMSGNGIFYTNDDGQNWSMAGPEGNEMVYKAVNGDYYMGSAQYGLLRSTQGSTWTPIPNSGFNVLPIIGDGKTMFLGSRGTQLPFFWTSPETDGNTWTVLNVPAAMTAGPVLTAYDSGHHLLYSANSTGGLWRMVTH